MDKEYPCRIYCPYAIRLIKFIELYYVDAKRNRDETIFQIFTHTQMQSAGASIYLNPTAQCMCAHFS